MAQIDFFADTFNLNGSGLGFYGAGFGQSVDVGDYQNTTFITNANGTAQGQQVNNVRYLNSFSGVVGSASSGILLTQIPNYLATLNVRFTHTSAIKAQNVKCRIYDRININNDPSGLICQVAELIHPSTIQTETGSGDTQWINTYGSGSIQNLAPSPGTSGEFSGTGSNSTRSDTRHDWYLALSESPSSIGSKLFNGLYISLEYL